jgi:chorismate mutase/prephenate dehydratase
MKLDGWRHKIDAIDTAMLHLLSLRTELALEVGRAKRVEGAAVRVPQREQEIIERLKSINPGPLDNEAIEKIYRLIFDMSVRAQEQQMVAEATRSSATPVRAEHES